MGIGNGTIQKHVFVEWREQCKYCKNQGCSYKEANDVYINELIELERKHKNAFGQTNFWCDYFYYDEKHTKELEQSSMEG